MNIELSNNIKAAASDPQSKVADPIKTESILSSSIASAENSETRQSVDKATGLLQTVVTEKISDEIIRKMPADEYLQLLSLLDEMISGSVDKKV